ncbi:phage integrase N-terminal SAM-like domain-containing protein [Pedosphaera parvula]|uniref:phage integrase N-terminal SAM-like domain-containing protein n=1 Tax=Pedosphaera parvula TaxID=1032527 RepID=UPI00135F10C1
MSSKQKLKQFLTSLAQKSVATSTLNQAFNAVSFFYKDAVTTLIPENTFPFHYSPPNRAGSFHTASHMVRRCGHRCQNFLS